MNNQEKKNVSAPQIIGVRHVNADKNRQLTVIMWLVGTFSFIWNTVYGTIAKYQGFLSAGAQNAFIACLCILFVDYIIKSAIKTNMLNLNRFGTLLNLLVCIDIFISFVLGIIPLGNKIILTLKGSGTNFGNFIPYLIDNLGLFVMLGLAYSVINVERAFLTFGSLIVDFVSTPPTYKLYSYDAENGEYTIKTCKNDLTDQQIAVYKKYRIIQIAVTAFAALLLLISVIFVIISLVS